MGRRGRTGDAGWGRGEHTHEGKGSDHARLTPSRPHGGCTFDRASKIAGLTGGACAAQQDQLGQYSKALSSSGSIYRCYK